MNPLQWSADALDALGDWAQFSLRAARPAFDPAHRGDDLVALCVRFGVQSTAVVAVTGFFIGMVMAVQLFPQFRRMGLETLIGSMIHITLIRELGPVLAASMLAGRVGTAMAAELGTMRVTEQIDALTCLGVDPVKHLVTPRFLAGLMMTPLLTILANACGIAGAALVCLTVYGIDAHHYWQHADDFITRWDLVSSLIKPLVFGGVTALICCHSGFRGRGGSEGVGRAATQAFVRSFIAILVIDFFLGLFLNSLHERWSHDTATGLGP